ncbi:hypothetical protein EFP23_14285 [Lacticaseibacillus paracasei]|nr:hypothetical protein [Lacticaseibacillus paracasei]
MLCKHHFSKNGQVFFHIFWVVTLIMQSRKISYFPPMFSGFIIANTHKQLFTPIIIHKSLLKTKYFIIYKRS